MAMPPQSASCLSPCVLCPAVQISTLMGGTAAALMYGYWKIGPKRRYKARMRDMRSLRCAERAGRAEVGLVEEGIWAGVCGELWGRAAVRAQGHNLMP